MPARVRDGFIDTITIKIPPPAITVLREDTSAVKGARRYTTTHLTGLQPLERLAHVVDQFYCMIINILERLPLVRPWQTVEPGERDTQNNPHLKL
jgi:hypothetical protein